VFSTRLPRDFHPNRLTLALEAKRREGARILDLTQSNPTQAGLAYPPEILCAFQDERLLRYEPNPAGLQEARAAVSRYYAARGFRVEPERILLTSSTSEAYSYLFKLLTDPGDHVLAPRPSYPLFEPLAHLESIAVRSYPVSYDGRWAIDTAALESAITERTRAIVLVNPNNPTGSYLKRPELQELLRISEERQIALISDEVFADYSFGSDAGRVATLAGVQTGLAFAMSGLSKIAGLPQMKMGWIVAAGAADLLQSAFQRLEWIADTYLSVGAPVQCAATPLLQARETIQLQIRARTLGNLQLLQRRIAGSAATVFAVEGGWYAIIQVPRVRTEEEWALDLLSRCNVLVQPGFFYDFESEAFLVASLLAHPDIFREGLERFRHFIDS
jgi:alanine-synthesizing transaminase